ncbi:glycoside hydrolase family 6 protein [uncultured Pseudokineococcus sp.]|uniref:glycoside hydrolase family 6 protein n=1 Tax=uncultured Pseudokineococcus sp. TaxID=1642928 RepID=UPI00262A7C45|nr:glycoside hydrolase family 6 protein [uncultured Pseudokineococcus sp.]
MSGALRGARPARTRPVVLGVLCAGAVSALAACSAVGGPAGTEASSGSALAGSTFYLDPAGPAPAQVEAWRGEGRDADAADLAPLAEQPVATWFSGQQEDPFLAAQELTTAAEAAGEVPVLVAYNLPDRDCGSYSAGGAADADAWFSWLGSLAAGLEDRPAVVVLEPDAVAHALQGCSGESAQERFRMLAAGVDLLQEQEGARVYVDAGHSGWLEDLDELAAALRASGVGQADGFALNTSNFRTTEDSLAYGERLSSRLGGARFVVDTGRNGAGPSGAPEGSADDWCNPAGRAIGAAPTADVDSPHADALLWVKQPGHSDGACRPGEPEAGTWWPEQALDLARRGAGA